MRGLLCVCAGLLAQVKGSEGHGRIRTLPSPDPSYSPRGHQKKEAAWLVDTIIGYNATLHSTTRPWNVAGADLGIGLTFNDEFFMLFGDTFGVGSNFSDGGARLDWRSNTLAAAKALQKGGDFKLEAIGWNHDPSYFLRPTARQLLHAGHQFPGPDPDAHATELTVIPTAAWADSHTTYVWYMSVRHFDGDAWTCNNASIATATKSGPLHNNPLAVSTFTKRDEVLWHPRPDHAPNMPLQFAVANHGKHPDFWSHCPLDHHSLYLMGTPCGRKGAATLLKVPRNKILHQDEYKYFAGFGYDNELLWDHRPRKAEPVIPGGVGELSLTWIPSVRRWLALYTAANYHPTSPACGIVARVSRCLWEGWSDERLVLANGTNNDIVYGGFAHPDLKNPFNHHDGLIYFTASLHFEYNTHLAAFDIFKIFPELR
eukprot:Hpha_TRINITY_DN10331_c0_g1::TRINITY_DN10331_c0_g1_i1::g.116164::m.116164